MNILNKLTSNYLKLNKKRTIVTIIGIILSGAMITAVATLAVSFRSFMLDVEISQDGAWEAIFKDVKTGDIGEIVHDKRFTNVMLMAPVGMAKNPYSDDPFLYIKAYSKEALENMKIRLIEGSLPENENEIVLSNTFFDEKENEPKIGDTITLDIGKRMSDGYELIGSAEEENETFVKEETKSYVVCGKIKRPDFETSTDHYTSGVTLLNETKPITKEKVDIGVISKDVKKLYDDTEEIADELGLYTKNAIGGKTYQIKYNTYVLTYKGVNRTTGFQGMLYSVCGILIVVIMVGSILVIYNSFAISVSERKKQFGMLSSVGATKKQIQKSVLYEGMVLGGIGIPIGILSGIGGIGITLKIVNELLKPMMTEGNINFNLHLVVSWQSIVIAAILIAVTIYLSVMIPAKRASKISPIEAIRGNDDIKIKAKKLKTRKWIRKLFGIEGELALKNLKRSKKKYRTTVISLMISIILFISVSGFVGYMYNGFDSLYKSVDYDYSIYVYGAQDEAQKQVKKELKDRIEQSKNIDKLSIVESIYAYTQLTEDRLDSNMQKAIKEKEQVKQYFYEEDGKYRIGANVITLNEKQMKDYLKQLGITKLEDNQVILINYVDLLMSAKIEGNLTNLKEKENITLKAEIREKQNSKDDEVKYKEVTKDFEIVKVTDKMPFGVSNIGNPTLIVVTTNKGIENLSNDIYTHMYFTAKDEGALEEELKEIEKANTNLSMYIENVKQEIQSQRNLKLIINIFLYGFIALISAIGIANIFNTISTNINLRKREFAMLKSIGMTEKGFKKMLDLECIFYGTKALLLGLPIGILVCYLINQGFGNLVEFAFSLPWVSIIISIVSVYLVVFITMLYSSGKMKKENIIDTLRDENI